MEEKTKKKIIIILCISLVGMGLGILIYYTLKTPFLFLRSDRFMDYFNTLLATDDTYTGVSGGRSYFPFTYIILKIVKILIYNETMSYFITFAYTCIFIIGMYVVFFRKYELAGMIAITFLSYPMLWVFDRGNVEYMLFSLLLLFFVAWKKGKYKTAAVLLAFPTCMKLYPAIFLLLFLHKRKIKEFFICLLSIIIVMVGSYILLGGTKDTLSNAVGFFNNFNIIFSKGATGLQFSHTLWTGINYLSIIINGIRINPIYTTAYTIVIFVITALLAIYVIFYEKEEWKVITILTIMMITFPHVSFEYTLINMYIPIAFFIMEKNTKNWEDIVYAILLGLAIIPMNWFGDIYYNIKINLGLLLRPTILMTIILIMILTRNKEVVDNKLLKKNKKALMEG